MMAELILAALVIATPLWVIAMHLVGRASRDHRCESLLGRIAAALERQAR